MDPVEAADAIARFCVEVLPRRRDGAPPPGGSVHLHCTDVEGEWMIRERDDGTLEVSREHAKGSCALRGGAVTLLRVLRGEIALSEADVFGDAAVAARLIEGTDPG